MPSDPHDDERFALLAFRHLEGHATADELLELAATLRANPARLAEFTTLARHQGLLADLLTVPAAADPVPTVDEPRIGGATQTLRRQPSRRPRGWRPRLRRAGSGGWLAAAATLLVLLGGALVWTQRATPSAIARLEQFTDGRLERNGRIVSDDVLVAGDRLVTNAGGSAQLRLTDGSRIVLAADADAVLADDARLQLDHGTVQVSAAPRGAGRPLTIATPVAEAQVLGTRFTVTAQNGSARLEVGEGRVRFSRHTDGATLEVDAGAWAIVAPGTPFAVQRTATSTPVADDFVCGVNLNGGAVTIEDHRWWSQAEAVAKGLTLPSQATTTATGIAPVPAVERAVSTMLNTAVYVPGGTLAIALPLTDGDYLVELWLMENHKDGYRSLTIAIEGRTVATRVQAGDPLGRWHRLAYPVEMRDGRLDLVLGGPGEEPHLMGFTVRRR